MSHSSNPISDLGRPGDEFTELTVWSHLRDGGWQHLHGNFRDLGYSIEWHDFSPARDFDWSQSFHSGGLEICLNLAGRGWVQGCGERLDLAPMSAGFYLQSERELRGLRVGGEHHQFITVELSLAFLERYFATTEKSHHPALADLGKRKVPAQVSAPIRLTSEHQQLVVSLRNPPVYAAAQRMWYHAKALEIAAAILYQPMSGDELFCQRQKRQNQERVQKVIGLLKENLTETPALEEIGRRVGCSHFHLSRIFSQETGKSIFQYLRELRLERAAELLREGKMSVTQVAMEVGYSSPSHFSAAFRESFGCCPGLYPLPLPAQSLIKRKKRG